MRLSTPATARELVVGHVADVDLDAVDPVDTSDGALHPCPELRPPAPVRKRLGERDHDRRAVDGDAPDHAEVRDRHEQLGFVHGRERSSDLGLGRRHRGLPGRGRFPLRR